MYNCYIVLEIFMEKKGYSDSAHGMKSLPHKKKKVQPFITFIFKAQGGLS